jgi:hypothetical protein
VKGRRMSIDKEIREWLYLPEAYKHIENIIKRECTDIDFLRFAEQGILTISVYFENYKIGRACNITTDSNCHEDPDVSINGITIKISNEVSRIHSCYDVPVYSTAMLDIKKRILTRNGKSEIKHDYAMGGIFLTTPKTQNIYQLLECHHGTGAGVVYSQIDKQYSKFVQKNPAYADYIPAKKLPDDAEIIVRTTSIKEFKDSNNGLLLKEIKELNAKKETTYQSIIGALLACIDGSVGGAKKHPSFKDETALVEFIYEKFKGYPGLSKRTLEGKFAEAKRILR